MRIRRLDLTRYGKFTDAVLDFGEKPAGSPDLHIVYGLNEAGKSTALSATLDLLFGIEDRSRYNFLHPYPTMEIGGALDFGGERHEVLRIKRGPGQPSLFHPDRSPANPALVSGALSGLTRDAYRTMFSLDDETLEEGGNTILQSRGDLGELLFSASAGLAQIGQALAKAGEDADAIHKKRARSTEIAGLKQRLAELKTRRETLDTAASAYAGLAQTLARATTAYEATMAERGAAKAAGSRAARILKAAPDAEAYRATADALAAFESLPRAPDAWARELPALRDAETRTAALIETERERAGSLSREIETLLPDEALLAAASEIRALCEAIGRYATAEEDLPRRRTALAEREAALAGLLQRLGQSGHADPAALVLPAAVAGRLRELIEARSGVEARLRTAEEEFARASEALESAAREAGSAAGAGRPEADAQEGAFRRLADVLRRLRESDAPVRARLAARALPEARRRAAEALAALGGFSGDTRALAALVPPEPKRIEAWRAALADLDRRRARLRDRRQDAAASAAGARARLDTVRASAGAIDDAEAAALRTARDAAWTAHLVRLDAASAEVFASALLADDRIVSQRFDRMEDLSDLRRLSAELAAAEAGVASADVALAEVEAEAKTLGAEIAEAAGAVPQPEGDTRLATRLDRIEAFAQRRLLALDAAATLETAEREAASARGEAEAEREALAKACRLCGVAVDDESDGDGEGEGALPVSELAARAQASIERRREEIATAAAAAKALAERQAQAERRREERHRAVEAEKRWQADWAGALSGRWIGPGEGPGAVREILVTLADLPLALEARDELAHRIEAMTGDQRSLVSRLTDLLAALGETLGDRSPPRALADLTARLDEAERIAALARDRRAALVEAEAKAARLQEDMRLAAARKAEMTGLFGVETLAEVTEALERCAERARTERRLADLGEALCAGLRAPTAGEALVVLSGLDLAEVEREAAESEARQELLDARSRELFAEQTRAADALAAVGGGDEVARLQVERQTVLIELEEAARRHLTLKAGGLVADEALRRFRDRHRSTMMERASRAFAAMTRGDYAGLSARPDKDRETLIGLSREGGSKLAADMSKGTRFQLYLALRLAGYEEFASARAPVPFFADDIMETFDEPRSEEVLRLLSSVARMGQVVYFTHHRHLCDIARTVEPGVTVHRLGGARLDAAG